MSVTYWTLKVTGGTEKSLADWGLENPIRELLSHAASTVKLKLTVAAADNDYLFTTGQTATIYRNRTSSGGDSPTYSGGTIWFFGKFVDPTDSEQVPNAAHDYELRDPWHWLDRLTFCQDWYIAGEAYTGGGVIGSAGAVLLAKLILFVDIDGNPRTVAQVVTEILTYAIGAGAPLQIGTIDPTINSPSQPAASLTCAEALKRVLRCAPDCITFFDYTTTPPTLHVRQRSTLSAVSVALTATNLTGLELTPLYSSQVSGVIIEFDTLSSLNGTDYYLPTFDIYPGGTTAATDGVLIANLDLKGVSGNIVYQPITTQAVDPNSVDFLTPHCDWLNSLLTPPTGAMIKINSLSESAAPVIEAEVPTQDPDSGVWSTAWVDVSAAPNRDQYPNEIIDGAVAKWMARTHRRERITRKISYQLISTVTGTEVVVENKIDRTVAIVIETTNAGNGDATEKVYSTFEGTLGEVQPTGLAEYFYNALHTVYWRGQVTLTAGEVATTQLLGSLINLTGGTGKYSAINALVTRVREDLEHGEIMVEVGPPAHLSPSELLDLLRIWRNRVPGDFYGRKTGIINGRSTSLATKTAPTRSSGAAEDGRASLLAIQSSTDGTITISHDADNSKTTLTNGTDTILLDLANKVISIASGSGLAKQDLANGEISITDGTTVISGKLSDLEGSTPAQFQTLDLAIVTSGPDSNGCYTIEKQSRKVWCGPTL